MDDIDRRLAEFKARIPKGQAWPYDPLNTEEQREVIEIAIEARQEAAKLRSFVTTWAVEVAED